MKDLRSVEAPCVFGCANKRTTPDICCPVCWKTVPRALKLEFWAASKAATTGRGRKNNGKATPRLHASIRAVIEFLIVTVSKPHADRELKKAARENP